MIAKALEAIQSSAPKRAAYTRWILVVLAICIAVKSVWFARLGLWHARNLVDFDAFHIIAERVWRGDVGQAYDFMKLLDMQREASGGFDSFMPWTYPPQFSLLLAPLALLPTGLAYLLFVALTAGLFLVVLRSIAGNQFVLLLIVLFPAIEITMACGQNGFLTATLIGLFCLCFEDRPALAGLALGCMIIKPHLAIAFGVYAVLRRRWSAVMAAGSVVLISSAVCTIVFGPEIWSGLLQSIRDSSRFLAEGYYPLFRMISFYAALRTVGLSSSVAFLGQALSAGLALAVIAVAINRRLPTRVGLGLTAIVSLCFSPYAYDYDFLIFGIGLALLLPELQALARDNERGLIYLAAMLIGVYGGLRSPPPDPTRTEMVCTDILSISGFVMIALVVLLFIIVLRRKSVAPVTETRAADRLLQASQLPQQT